MFRWQNWVAYDQSKMLWRKPRIFCPVPADLILLVAQAYSMFFANEILVSVRAHRGRSPSTGIGQKNFEVGTRPSPISRAQARYAFPGPGNRGRKRYEIKRRALQSILGKEPGALAGLRKEAELTPPDPSNMSAWVAAAEKDSITVQIQQLAADIAAREVDKQRAGHYPTVDLVANYGHTKSFASTLGMLDTDFQNVGVQLNVPLYLGGQVVSREREAAPPDAALRIWRPAAVRAIQSSFDLGVPGPGSSVP